MNALKVEAFRYHAEHDEARRVLVNVLQLLSLADAVEYLRVHFDVKTSIETLRDAVVDGDHDCYVLITPKIRRRRRFKLNLFSDELRFTRRQIERSDWLYTETMVKRVAIEQGQAAAGVLQARMRHAGTVEEREGDDDTWPTPQ